MTEQRIDPVLVKKMSAAYIEASGYGVVVRVKGMEAALGVVLDELGLKEESRSEHVRQFLGMPGLGREAVPAGTRLVSDWRLVEQGDASGIPICGRLMVGSGGDSWDPSCELPDGHAGVCRSRSAIDQHRLVGQGDTK
jgi:hypothetical protein